jgi:hypothetical protein
MGEIVSLGRARKRRDHEKKELRAAGNRAKFGRSAAEKAQAEAEREKRRALLDGAKRDEEPA